MFWTIASLILLALCITAILVAMIVWSRQAGNVLEVRHRRRQRNQKLPPFSQAIIDEIKP